MTVVRLRQSFVGASMLLLAVIAPPALAAQASPAAIAAWRAAHERQIVDELVRVVALPNVARNDADMQANATLLTQLFQQRGFTVQAASGAGAPVILATLNAARPRGTLTFYIHYDGQPVDAKEWTRCGPFAPCLIGPTGPVTITADTKFDPEWRIYGRSASDDKGPIVALLNAIDALKATGRGPEWNIKVVLDGQEEAGSANFIRYVREQGSALSADLVLTLDGPRHPSTRPTMYYGVRGGAGLTLTVYTAKMDLHSGNYGNWAPDPSIRLARLLASMKDDDGRVTIEGFYDSVTPLTATERRALAAMPDVERDLARDFGIAQPERRAVRLEEKLNEPTLNVLAMDAGGGTKAPARTAIPAYATARLAMRLVQGIDPATQVELVVAHVRKQGFTVIEGRDPTDAERMANPRLVRIDRGRGNAAARVSMEMPLARGVATALTRNGVPPVQLPTLGGSMPFAEFSETLRLPTVGVSLVNHDNNQHGPDENIRLRNLFEGVELLAAIMTMPKPSTTVVP
jgi:acetylornithine deacetylase/succinyl-diaminopimelate desuccinylase-like protein